MKGSHGCQQKKIKQLKKRSKCVRLVCFEQLLLNLHVIKLDACGQRARFTELSRGIATVFPGARGHRATEVSREFSTHTPYAKHTQTHISHTLLTHILLVASVHLVRRLTTCFLLLFLELGSLRIHAEIHTILMPKNIFSAAFHIHKFSGLSNRRKITDCTKIKAHTMLWQGLSVTLERRLSDPNHCELQKV